MVKNTFTAIVVAGLLASAAVAAEWTVDQQHSSVGFTVRHLVISTVDGEFKDYSADISFEPGRFADGSVEMTVQVASIDTGEEDRDKHLRSADFFDAEQFPTMTFVSREIHDVTDDSFKMTGDLTIRGVTKEVTFDCEYHGMAVDPSGNTKAGFTATTEIDRQDFNVKWNKTLDAGGVVVGNEVKIILEIQLAMVK